MRRFAQIIGLCVVVVVVGLAGGAGAETLYVDDNAPSDPGAGDPLVSDPAEDGSPAHPFDAIQEAIDAASDDDMVIVRDGTYTGEGNRDINFNGKAVHLMSENGPDNCVIDCEGAEAEPHRGFYFHTGEGATSIVDGFKIINGYAPVEAGVERHARGGAIYCLDSSPAIINNWISGNLSGNSSFNSGTFGGGICCFGGAPMIINNVISGNYCLSEGLYGDGGGVYCRGSSAAVTGNTITGNHATAISGGIACMGSSSATITNNTITGNTSFDGGGISCYGSSPEIASNTIAGNTASMGGGITCWGSSPWITNNTIIDNLAQTWEGGGIVCSGSSSATITNNTIVGNTTDFLGGGIACYSSTTTITNNTIRGNSADYYGGGISCYSSSPVITNSIVWDNTPDQIAGGSPVVTYCDVQGGYPGTGNMDEDPRFADAPGDYHLKSKDGRWDPSANGGDGGWVYDDVASPCVDAGNPAGDFANEPDPNGGRINMGAYGSTAQASKNRAGQVILVGPMERGEGPLPPVVGDPTDPATFGEFTVDIYAEDMSGFAGVQLQAEFLDSLSQNTPGFWVSYSTPNPLFGSRAIVHNTLFLPEIQSACAGQTVGLLSMEKEWIVFPPGWGDFIDKSIPPEEHLAAVNPPEMIWPGREGLTWLISVNYWYTSDVPSGTYTLDVARDLTAFGDNRADPPLEIPYTVVAGGVAIGSSLTGDVTGDCIVNVLDMIAVRNHLYEDPTSGDNWRYNVTGDGLINVLDMLAVRNNARATCP